MKKNKLVVIVVALVMCLGLLVTQLSQGSEIKNSSSGKKEEETPVQQQTPPDAVVTINGNVKYQSIDNFGASDAWSMDPLGKHWTEENKNRVADLLFSREKGIGLSAWRFNIGAGSAETDKERIPDPWRRAEAFKMSENGSYDWSKQAGQQWFLQAAADRGVDTLIAFVNSPPVWMTKNGHAQPEPQTGSTNLKPNYEKPFATFLVDVLTHFKNQGLEFDYISPINEPTWDWNDAWQEANRYNNDDLKRVILELYRQLGQSELKAKISAPDGVEITSLLDDEYYKQFAGSGTYSSGANKLGTGKYREYIKDLLGDAELKQAVGNKIASHSYWSDYSKPGDDRLVKLRQILHDNLVHYDPDAKYWVTEYCILGDYGPGRDLGIEPALQVAKTIHFDLAEANASAWQWWTAVSKVDYKDGLIYTDYNEVGDEQNILTSKILWALGNYSKFIRPGAQRIELTGLNMDSTSMLLGSAYVHDVEQTVSAVFVNTSNRDKRVNVSLENLGLKGEVAVLESYITNDKFDLARGSDVVAGEGDMFEVVIPAQSVVTLTGRAAKGGTALEPNSTNEEAVRQAAAALELHNINDVRGNITLPLVGANGATITWQTSDSALMTATGEVSRPKAGKGDDLVELTAFISLEGVAETKKFKLTIKEKKAEEALAGYLFSYFAGEGNPQGEQVYFALSEGNNPLRWRELNGGKPVLTSTLGEKGIRDPFLIRSPEGDRFYLIATDLKIHGNWDWGRAQSEGSRFIIVWESNDLLTWSEPRRVEVAPPEAGNTWAPEAFYDEESGDYVVFWASRLFEKGKRSGGDGYQKILYSKTRDFYTFTEPQLYMDFGYSTIDTTMIAHNGKIHRFTKDERENEVSSPYGKMVFHEVLDSIFDTNNTMVKEGAGEIKGVEGPTIFKSNTEDKWYLFVDEFRGRGYIPLETRDLNSGKWTVSANYALPKSPRHGTVIPVTKSEYEAIAAKFGVSK